MNKCKGCGGSEKITDYKHGEILCKKCGLVLNDALFDTGPEWRAFDKEQSDKRARTGGPLKFAKLNLGLTTEIDKYDRDILGKPVPTIRKAKLYRLRYWQRRSRMGTSVDRNLSIALPELDRMCAYLNIPNNIKEECAQLYRKCVNKKIIKGRSIESVIAATIYLISRNHKMPKTLEELENVAGVKKRDIGKSYRTICRRLGIKMPVITAVDYVPRLASEAGISGETTAIAMKMLEDTRESGAIAGKVPISMAAAGVYLAARITGDKKCQKIKSIAGISESAIKSRYVELEKIINGEVLLEDIDTGITEKRKPEEEPTLDDMLWKIEKKKILLKFADELRLSDKTKKEAVEILGKVMENDFKLDPRENINGYLGAAIYLADKNNDRKCKQKGIALIVGVSVPTISYKGKIIEGKLSSFF
ncbi:transcription initiation factor IIB [Candidatus Parcubacteria bacterium]|nr:transcription initiation factor IIB [Candidatus Parcubacteria bacterium]